MTTSNAGAAPFELAVEAAPSGIVVVQPDGRIVLVNRELERLFGYDRSELAGKPIDILVPESIEAARRQLSDAFDAGEGPGCGAGRELSGRRKDGAGVLIDVGMKVISSAGSALVLASIVDITERRRLQELRQHEVDDQIRFQRLVAELSVAFINHPSSTIHEGIEEALRRVATAFEIDRATFHRLDGDSEAEDVISWAADGIPPLDDRAADRERLPWTTERVLAGAIASFSTRLTLPLQ